LSSISAIADVPTPSPDNRSRRVSEASRRHEGSQVPRWRRKRAVTPAFPSRRRRRRVQRSWEPAISWSRSVREQRLTCARSTSPRRRYPRTGCGGEQFQRGSNR
jgi:hypothetical protein